MSVGFLSPQLIIVINVIARNFDDVAVCIGDCDNPISIFKMARGSVWVFHFNESIEVDHFVHLTIPDVFCSVFVRDYSTSDKGDVADGPSSTRSSGAEGRL